MGMDASGGGLGGLRVLVLNSSYEPLRIVSWQRAMLLFLGEKIDVLDSYNVAIHSVSQAFHLPAVIKMKRFSYIKKRRSGVRFSRAHVFMRDDFMCQYCRTTLPAKQLTLDHVMPVVRGGETSWTNIVTCCAKCNQKKGSQTPAEAGMKLSRPPKEPKVGSIPDLLMFRSRELPESWRPYLQGFSII